MPALQARREDASIAFTGLIAVDDPPPTEVNVAKRQLMARIIVSGAADIVTSWINGTLVTV